MRILVVLSLILCLGCQKGKQHSIQKNILKSALQGDIESFHPHRAPSSLSNASLQCALFEGLTRINTAGKAEPAAAEKIFLSEDGLEYTFTLRPQKWSNGEKVTAHDYEKAWKHALEPETDCDSDILFFPIKNAQKAKIGLASLEEIGIKALDSKTLKVILEKPLADFLELAAKPPYLPLWRGDLNSDAPGVFNGPFVLKRYLKEHLVQLARNPFYWDVENVFLDGVDLLIVHDPSTALEMFTHGELDWVGRPFFTFSEEQLSTLNDTSELHFKNVANFFQLSLNAEIFPLNSDKIRSALLSALSGENCAKNEESRSLFKEAMQELQLAQETFPPLRLALQGKEQVKVAEKIQTTWQTVLGIRVILDVIENPNSEPANVCILSADSPIANKQVIPLDQEKFYYLKKPCVEGFILSDVGLIDFKNIALK